MKIKFDKGEQVRINEGPFANFNGAVDDVNEDKQTLKVMVSIFGRSTPVEIEFSKVDKVDGVVLPCAARSTVRRTVLKCFSSTNRRSGQSARGSVAERGFTMAPKKITGYVKLQITGGKATPAPPVGPALGQAQVNIMEFCKQFNAPHQGLRRWPA